MRFPIRKIFLAPAVLAASALATSSALAATPVQVPFSFTVAGKTCPAGNYTVFTGPLSNTVRLVNQDSSRNFVWIVEPGDPQPTDHRVILTFDTRGDGHELRTVQLGNRVTSRLDKPSKEYTPTRIVSGD
jgi:hypothetical protein